MLVYTLFLVYTAVSANKTTLHVGALFELSNHWYAEYVNFFVDILDHAFDEINNRSDILEDYSLKLITRDTQGHPGLAAKRLFELMSEERPMVAVLGPTLSPELVVVGQITPVYHLLHLSYIASTSSTLDRERFPTMFKVNQIMDELNPLRIKMMQYFGWRRVGTIFFQDDVNVSHMNLFHELLKQYNMTLVTSAVMSDDSADVKPLIARLLQYDVRIIMASFRSTKATRIFCEAYHQGLYGDNYVWILPGPIFHMNWITDDNDVGCSSQQLKEATDGNFILNYDRLESRNLSFLAKKSPAEVKAELEKKLAGTNLLLSRSFGWLYDTAWALAVGLENSLDYLNASGLVNYTYSSYYLNALLKGMDEVSFNGVSGPVSFDAGRSRAGVTYIEQISHEDNTRVRVAMYDYSADTLNWFIPAESLWTDGVIPQDRFTYRTVLVEPSVVSLILITIGNTLCLFVATGFLGFNIYYRNNSNIKLSSPKINNVIITGSIMMYICVFLTMIDYGHMLPEILHTNICMVRVWIMCLGFTSLFGALFSKTWRVHIIFRNYKRRKTVIKDRHLFGIVVFLLLMDCILLVSWSSTHRLQTESFIMNIKDQQNSNNVIAEVYMYCYHPMEGYWFAALYIYKGLLLAFGTFLAWETRQVTVPALNDSKYIGFCIYNVCVVCTFGVPLMHVLPTGQTTLKFVLISSFVMFCTTLSLCILFIPKIKLRNKVSEKFLVSTLNPTTASSGSEHRNQSDKRKQAESKQSPFELSRDKITTGSGDRMNTELSGARIATEKK